MISNYLLNLDVNMKQVDYAVLYLKENLELLNLEWVNNKRISDDWKTCIIGHKLYKHQMGIYDRKNIILVRLEKYDTDIKGITVYPTVPKGDSWKASFSRFKDGKGICIKVDTVETFKILVSWYFSSTEA